jgi:hypothetical protein
MNLNFLVRFTYLFAWVAAVVAIIYRGLQIAQVHAVSALPVSSRGLLFLSAFLFLACMATISYAGAQHPAETKSRGAAA